MKLTLYIVIGVRTSGGCFRYELRREMNHILCLIHIKNPTRCNSVSKFYFTFICSSTCFGQHPAHHQEPKTVLAASGFAYMEGCWTCICWTASSNYTCVCVCARACTHREREREREAILHMASIQCI